MNKSTYILGILIISVIAQAFLASAQMYEVDYNNTGGILGTTDAKLVVGVLKYDPYPVNAGDWFDLWVKVQNIGQNDATNARFELVPEYPFSSDDVLIRDYGLIYGTAGAYKVDQTADSSQVILKYRVKVAESAPSGESNLKLSITSNKNSGFSTTVNLPIEIAKTKTDFDVVMQDSTSQGMSFAISNIGKNDASAVTVSIEPSASITATGPSSSIIGNLAKGDFTTVTFQVSQNNRTRMNQTAFGSSGGYANRNQTMPSGYRNSTSNMSFGNLNEARVLISYTDVAGVRNSVEKIVPISSGSASSRTSLTNRTTTTSVPSYAYVIIGIVLGVIGFIVYSRFGKKKIS